MTIAGYPGETVTSSARQPARHPADRGRAQLPDFPGLHRRHGNTTRAGGEPGLGSISVTAPTTTASAARGQEQQGFGIAFSKNTASPFNEVLNSKIHNTGNAPATTPTGGLYVSTIDNLFAGNYVYDNEGFGFPLL